jgi:hypothetical protein
MTFTVEDALISPVSLAMLTGAGFDNYSEAGSTKTGAGKTKHSYIYQPVQFDVPIVEVNDVDKETGDILTDGQMAANSEAKKRYVVKLDWDTVQEAPDIYYSANNGQIFGTVLDNAGAGVYFLTLDAAGINLIDVDGGAEKVRGWKDSGSNMYSKYHGERVDDDTDNGHVYTIPSDGTSYLELTFANAEKYLGCTLRVDCYCQRSSGARQMTIDAENFAGDYYVEASTLFRDQYTKKDMPAVFVIPDVKIQSNFTFSMSNSGDPSTFTFTMDAFPDYTKFDKTKKVFCAIQIIGDENVVPSETTDESHTDAAVDNPKLSVQDSVSIKDEESGKVTSTIRYGRNLSVSQTKANFDFYGTVYSQATAPAENVLGSNTGHYIPFTLGADGASLTYTFKENEDAEAKTVTVESGATGYFGVDSSNPIWTVKINETEFTLDFTKCNLK